MILKIMTFIIDKIDTCQKQKPPPNFGNGSIQAIDKSNSIN